ncbi:hypothetical protein [Mesorhizobium sp.]|nr:hypothetical protein [Mesorhizobium sp.]RWN57343.1 MAG: hypothetical protein EOR98_07015 [Mesorhizobium sp.]RWN82639.1 MAG: hypothetical protein EOS01_06365 [Mesorhizobium sp.]RWO14718.1 MAG: hypothetical protein EOS15_14035 [Mesorhizobium sp.]RWO47559.1 MAG: hypothetical protein EOS13_25350 [Mesorhizobium sp.]RWO72354.1 MAG: hypothetical protein EOS16_05865 [Mesorhizobium sp.]
MAAGPAFRKAKLGADFSNVFPGVGIPTAEPGSTVISLLQRQARRLVRKPAKGKGTVMKFLAPVTKLAAGFRKFVAPRYRPELYYMRGPGPATARRMGTRRQNQSIDHYA